MICNANDLTFPLPKFDYCVIGSGAGGSTVALELLKSGKSVILLEAGNLVGNSEILHPVNVGAPFGLRSTRSISVGGTSNLWHGVIAPLDQVDFKYRNWVPDSGWPISYDDLLPYYVSASEFLGSNCYEYFDKRKLPLFLKSLLQVINFNEECIENKIFQRPLPVKRLSNSLFDQFSKSGSGFLVYNICALEIITNDENAATEIKCGIQGVGLKSIFANQFVVCAGALETPRLLLNSGFSNRNIGRYLMDHPMASVGQVNRAISKRAWTSQSLFLFKKCVL